MMPGVLPSFSSLPRGVTVPTLLGSLPRAVNPPSLPRGFTMPSLPTLPSLPSMPRGITLPSMPTVPEAPRRLLQDCCSVFDHQTSGGKVAFDRFRSQFPYSIIMLVLHPYSAYEQLYNKNCRKMFYFTICISHISLWKPHYV